MGCSSSEESGNKKKALIDDFAKRYPITCTENQLNEKINKFIEDTENDIQESFFKENTNDMAFELLKKEERKFLVNYLNTKKTLLTTDLNNKLNEFRQIVNNFDELTTKTINCENGEKIYKNKMKREIEKINKKLESFKIDYLSIILVGQSGVGKSTLINNFLKLKGRKVAATGTGRYVTQTISYYMSNEIPYLRLIDTRGIELNVNYGAEAVKNDTSAFIKEQLITGNINNFVSCIWYCITGNRFQQVEEDLLNDLRSTYRDNSIPIIIVYTQAVDKNAMTEMDAFIKKRKIDATFIRVLAEKKELANNTFLEPFGLDDLLKETLLKCKKAIQGDMRKVMANNIALYIKDVLIKENSYIRKYINEVTVNNIINKGYTIKSHSDFENFIFNIFGNNIRYFFEKTNEIINSKNSGIFKTSEIIRNNYNVYKSFFEEKTNSIIINDINNLSIHLLDLQAKIEKTNDIHIYTKNKRLLDDFKNTSTKFFQDNFYCIAQKYYIRYIVQNISNNLSICFEKHLNELIENIIGHNDIMNQIGECFLKKFADFEERIGKPNNNNIYNYNYNYNYNPVNFNQNNGINNIQSPEKSEDIKDRQSNKKNNKELPYKENSFNNENEYPEIELHNIDINIKVPNGDINNDKITNLDAPKIEERDISFDCTEKKYDISKDFEGSNY